MNNLLVGITTDFALAEPGRDANFFLKSSYVTYIQNGGAKVVLIPFSDFFDPDDWSFLDGIILSGSVPDIPPHFYGAPQKFFGRVVKWRPSPPLLDLAVTHRNHCSNMPT